MENEVILQIIIKHLKHEILFENCLFMFFGYYPITSITFMNFPESPNIKDIKHLSTNYRGQCPEFPPPHYLHALKSNIILVLICSKFVPLDCILRIFDSRICAVNICTRLSTTYLKCYDTGQQKFLICSPHSHSLKLYFPSVSNISVHRII